MNTNKLLSVSLSALLCLFSATGNTQVKLGYKGGDYSENETEVLRNASCYTQSAAVITALVKAGAKINANDIGREESPIFYAARCQNRITIKNLAALGANVDSFNRWGRTPLMVAAEQGSDLTRIADAVATLDALLAAGADINKANPYGNVHEDEQGMTALMSAAKTNASAELVMLLINAKPVAANKNLVDSQGHNALWFAENYNKSRPEIAAALK